MVPTGSRMVPASGSVMVPGASHSKHRRSEAIDSRGITRPYAHTLPSGEGPPGTTPWASRTPFPHGKIN